MGWDKTRQSRIGDTSPRRGEQGVREEGARGKEVAGSGKRQEGGGIAKGE